MSWSSSIGIDTMLKYSDSTPLIYQEKIKNSTIKLSLEAERTALAARNNQDPLDSFLWDAEIPHQTWLLLSFQKAFSSIKEGISVSFALHCCQPNVWSDWSPTCFTLFTLNKFLGLKKKKLRIVPNTKCQYFLQTTTQKVQVGLIEVYWHRLLWNILSSRL